MASPLRPGSKPPDESATVSEIEPQERLTYIHQRVHCVATTGTTDENDELDEIQIAAFLDALVEVALEIANRKEQLDK